MSRICNENKPSKHGFGQRTEELSLHELEEKSEDKGTPCDKEAMFSRRDQETHRSTYFQEAILILDEVKKRFLPKTDPKGKVRKMIYHFVPSFIYNHKQCCIPRNHFAFILYPLGILLLLVLGLQGGPR